MKKYIIVKELREVLSKSDTFISWSNGESDIKLFDTKKDAEKTLVKLGHKVNLKAESQRENIKKHPQKQIMELLSQLGPGVREFMGMEEVTKGIGIHEVEVLDEMWMNFGEVSAFDVSRTLVIKEYREEQIYYLSKKKLESSAIIPPKGLYTEDQSQKYFYFEPKVKTIIDLLSQSFKNVKVNYDLEYEVSNKDINAIIEVEEDNFYMQTKTSLKKEEIEKLMEPVTSVFNKELIIAKK